MLRDIVPDLRRVAIVANPEHPGVDLERTYSVDVGRRLEHFPLNAKHIRNCGSSWRIRLAGRCRAE
jgi:hypothetical protein